jgi:uncharacterized protein (TIGR00645 family)
MAQGPVREKLTAFEQMLETGLFMSRWLMAPFYVGLVVALAMLLIVFVHELVNSFPEISTAGPEEVILTVLDLIDLSLAGNLVLIVIFSGYENFVSKINIKGHEDRPSWMGTLDFSGLKIKLVGSIVAISAISLLRAFMTITQTNAVDQTLMFWLVILHLTFVTSGVLFAVMDWIASLPAKHGNAPAEPAHLETGP